MSAAPQLVMSRASAESLADEAAILQFAFVERLNLASVLVSLVSGETAFGDT
jgi:hypothetical protein